MPFKAGPKNLVTDVEGLRVGQSCDEVVKTGTTAIIFDEPAVASCQTLGGAPGTRETDLLDPHNVVEGIDALVLSGGSAFGLAAAGGVQDWLRESGRGFAVGPSRIPIVPAAILFDLINGGAKDDVGNMVYYRLGRDAAMHATRDFEIGNHGAGMGALTADLKGGLGSASTYLEPYDITVGAIVAANPLGTVTVGGTRYFWAAPFELGDELGGLGLPNPLPQSTSDLRIKLRASETANTTIGAIVTDAALTKAQCKRLAIAAHDGFTRAIWPSHTPFDGDIIFAASTAKRSAPEGIDAMIDLCAAAGATIARAIARGIHAATPSKGDILPCWSQRR
ncbi:MAG: P1 family peptidase [Pseudomonadota bacterium]